MRAKLFIVVSGGDLRYNIFGDEEGLRQLAQILSEAADDSGASVEAILPDMVTDQEVAWHVNRLPDEVLAADARGD